MWLAFYGIPRQSSFRHPIQMIASMGTSGSTALLLVFLALSCCIVADLGYRLFPPYGSSHIPGQLYGLVS
jgi:hypothetical protein